MFEKVRNDKWAILWAIIRIYVGYEFITAGWHKILNGFSVDNYFKGAIAKVTGDHPAVQAWYGWMIQHIWQPMHGVFNVIIPWGEFLAGIGLILGVFTTYALLAAALMNLNFMLAGSTSTNPQLYTLEIILLVIAGASAYRWGVDYYLLPKLKKSKDTSASV